MIFRCAAIVRAQSYWAVQLSALWHLFSSLLLEPAGGRAHHCKYRGHNLVQTPDDTSNTRPDRQYLAASA